MPTAKVGLSLQAAVVKAVAGHVLIVCRERIARVEAKRTKKKILAPIASSPKMIWTMSISNSVLVVERSSIVAAPVRKLTGKNTVIFVKQ